MKVLVINAGSSSLKYQLIDMNSDTALAAGNCDRIGIDGNLTHKSHTGAKVTGERNFPTHKEAFKALIHELTEGEAAVISCLSEISAIGHRVVHGGQIFSAPTLVTDEVINEIDALSELAPVHNPAHVVALKACKEVFSKDAPQVAVFDTAFHQTIPPHAYTYAIPYEYYEKYHVRKYGFHGSSHRFVSARLAETLGKDVKDLKIVSCHLGNGSSICAVDGGKAVDTSMGFTPLDGMIMGTRCGEIDASAVSYLCQKLSVSPREMSDILNKKSGFLGLTGISSDNREVTAAYEKGDARAKIATDILRYRIKKYIGAYAAAMGGLDCVLFTGGIGENDPGARFHSCQGLEFLGIKIDENVNQNLRGTLARISAPDSKVEVWIVPTNEELLIARDTVAVVNS